MVPGSGRPLPLLAAWGALWELIAAKSPVTARFGGDVTLSCLFLSQPGMNLQRLTLTWQKERAGTEALVVHSHYYGKDQLGRQDEVYRNRTRLDPEGSYLFSDDITETPPALVPPKKLLCMKPDPDYKCYTSVLDTTGPASWGRLLGMGPGLLVRIPGQ
ncbi:glyoxylate reductase [Platysternon megacephalum]|uniref:Glyoxylate reductase n=1 Tax=Platysternon megacephalum TaxID=55544 RepID=A0A4D9DIT6_9SAUR|nr:glyoxylate reductase [Platysternon megacephalum]